MSFPSTDPKNDGVQAPQPEPNHYVMQVVRALAMGPLIIPKTLIQIGFEPVRETATKTLFNKPGFRRASILTFWKFLHRKGGMWAFVLGSEARILEALATTYANELAAKTLGPMSGLRTEQGERTTVDDDSWTQFSKEVALDAALNSVGVLASHPFYVIGTRTIAQWVCGDGAFLNLPEAVRVIFAESGVAGFYDGLVPALLQEATYVVTISFLHKLFERMLQPFTKDLQPEQTGLLSFIAHHVALTIANPFFFPFSTVKALMATNRSSLHKNRNVPLFGSWTSAFEFLYHLNGFGPRGLLRGSSNFRRVYAKPLDE